MTNPDDVDPPLTKEQAGSLLLVVVMTVTILAILIGLGLHMCATHFGSGVP